MDAHHFTAEGRQGMPRNTALAAPAADGEPIVSALSRQLASDCGHGFSATNPRHMPRLAEGVPDPVIVSAAQRQLSEYLTVLPPKDVLQAKLHEAIEHSRARLENRDAEAA